MTKRRDILRSNRNRGSVYVLVLGAGTLLAVSAISLLTIAQVSARSSGADDDAAAAGVLAQSAVEYALNRIGTDPSWRSSYASGVETSRLSLGAGTISFKLVDESDGNLANGYSPVRIHGIGRHGPATRVFSVQAAGSQPLTCLSAAVVVGGDLSMQEATIDASGLMLASNKDVYGGTSPGAIVKANVQASGTVYPQNWNLTGTATSSSAKREMPDSSVFDYYIANGTVIPYSKIFGGTIQLTLISPAHNPYNTGKNAKGIYVIDCGGQVLTIKNCRIIGTLVVLNPGAGSRVGAGSGDDGVCWEPAVENYPCLLVNGDMTIGFNTSKDTVVSEWLLGNYNPPGAPYPYPSGTTDLDVFDSYPSKITGLVYVSGNVAGNPGTSNLYPSLANLIVGGNYVPGKGTLTLTYKSIYKQSPPPGFTGGGIPRTIAGTWRREPSP